MWCFFGGRLIFCLLLNSILLLRVMLFDCGVIKFVIRLIRFDFFVFECLKIVVMFLVGILVLRLSDNVLSVFFILIFNI